MISVYILYRLFLLKIKQNATNMKFSNVTGSIEMNALRSLILTVPEDAKEVLKIEEC